MFDAIGRVRAKRRRWIDPKAGRALEILGHAIEYLTDEFVRVGGNRSAHGPLMEAIQLLMERNREVRLATNLVTLAHFRKLTLAHLWKLNGADFGEKR